MVNESLEGGKCIGEAERHHSEFIVPLVCSKCCFTDAFFPSLALVVVHSKINVKER